MSSEENQYNVAATIGGSLGGDVVVKSKGPGKDVDMERLKAMRKAKKKKKDAAKKGAETKAKNKSNNKSSTAIVAKSSMAAVATKPSEMKAPPVAVVPHKFGVHGNNYKGPRTTKSGKKDGRSGDVCRQTVSNARQVEMKAGTNNVVNAKEKRQKLAGGTKKEIFDKLFTAVENDRRDALHGLLLRRKNDRRKGHWSINNNGGGPQNLLPGEPWSILSARLRFTDVSKMKSWLTSDSKSESGPQVYKWSSENKTKGLTLKSYTNSTVWMTATLHFEPV